MKLCAEADALGNGICRIQFWVNDKEFTLQRSMKNNRFFQPINKSPIKIGDSYLFGDLFLKSFVLIIVLDRQLLDKIQENH